MREALSGERVASFLPIVAQLGEEYDPHAIAAAALQLAYDQTRPSWLDSEFAAEEEETQLAPPKPKLNRRVPRPSVSQGSESTRLGVE